MKGLIIEGIPGSGKSTILKEVLNSDQYQQKKAYSEIFLSEIHTQRILEVNERTGTLQKSDNVSLLNFHLDYINSFYNGLISNDVHGLLPNRSQLSVLLERFHLTHYYYYHNMINWSDVESIDLKLAEMDFKLCVLLIDKKAILERLIKGRSDNEQWMEYIHTFGKKNSRIINHFLEQQERLMCSLSKTNLCYMSINTSTFYPKETAEKIIDFWFA